MNILTDEEKLSLADGAPFAEVVRSVRPRVGLLLYAMRAIDAWLASDEACAMGLHCRCVPDSSIVCSYHSRRA